MGDGRIDWEDSGESGLPSLPEELRGKEIRPTGMFRWDGELFGWMPHEDDGWEGYTIVYDEHDMTIATALTAELAIRVAIDELEFWQHTMASDISEILGSTEC